MTRGETLRQWIHIGSAAFALLLRVLAWWQAAMLAALALVFNALVLPRIGGRRLYRPRDEARGFPLGILLYPLSVLLLILVFPARRDIVAAAWGILAFGDGAATLAGRRARTWNAGRRGTASACKIGRSAPTESRSSHRRAARVGGPLPWNRDKTIAGTIAFVVFGSAAGVALAWWTRPAVSPPPAAAFLTAAPVLAAIAAALVESMPVRLDDNLSVPFTAGGVLWLATLFTPAAWSASRDAVMTALPWAVAFNAAVAWLGYRARAVSVSGAAGGAMVGIVIYAAGGAGAWVLLLAAFLLATAASRLGLKRKVLLGIAEERGGRRGAGNAVANCGVAAIAALGAAATPYAAASRLALAAALTAGGSDTVASEIGKAWGRSTFLVTNLGRVKPGTPGAMSFEGTAAGLVAALALAALAAALGLIPAGAMLPVVAGATSGAIVESVLAATLEGPGILDNDMLNFINTAVAAAVALILT